MSIMGIKVIKEKRATDFTFIDDGLNLKTQEDSKLKTTKDKTEPEYRLHESTKLDRLKKSRKIGGHGMQGHSPIYE